MIKKKLRVCLTSACNFQCAYCWAGGEGIKNSNPPLSDDVLIYITKYLSEKYMFSFLRLTGGEPLLRKSFFEVVNELKQTNCFDKITMVTNGSLIDEEVACKLAELKLKSITVSLDTLHADIFESITQVDKLDKVCLAIKYLKEKKVNVKINSVITKANREGVFELIDFASDLNVPIKLLDYIVCGEEDLENNYQAFSEIKQRLRAESEAVELQYQDEGFGIPEEVYNFGNTKVVVKDSLLGSCYSSELCAKCKNYPCQTGIVSFTLTHDGLLKLCTNEKHIIDLKPLLHNDEITIKKLDKLIYDYEQSSFSNSWQKGKNATSKLEWE